MDVMLMMMMMKGLERLMYLQLTFPIENKDRAFCVPTVQAQQYFFLTAGLLLLSQPNPETCHIMETDLIGSC